LYYPYLNFFKKVNHDSVFVFKTPVTMLIIDTEY
jgi:hypothetical protein